MGSGEVKVRIIIRFSLDGDHGSPLRNKLVAILKSNNMKLVRRTGSYEPDPRKKPVAAHELAQCLAEFWECIRDYPGPGKLDHFWMYADKQSDQGKPAPSQPGKNTRKMKKDAK